jgi:hypothetical protein
MPHLMNCGHSDEGWCLDCVRELHDAAKLRDPVLVHAAMLRGEIATPAIRDMLHVYGEDALARWDSAPSAPANALMTALQIIDKHSVNTIHAHSSDCRDWAEDIAYIGKVAREALDAFSVPSGEPDWRHPKIQALIGAKARREIELQLVEQLLDNPDCDLSAMDMEYWNGLHDKLREKLIAAQTARETKALMALNTEEKQT